MKTLLGLLALGAPLVIACSSGTSTSGGGAAAEDGGDAAAHKGALSAAAQASAFLGKCRVGCQPPAGPCAGGDVNACINDCTSVVEGLPVLCAQCITEHSGWDGSSCESTGRVCRFSRSRPPSCSTSACEEGGNCPEPKCAASDEKCDGYSFAKASSECQAECR